MFSKCGQCGFYVRQNDEFCLNCGCKEFGEKIKEPSFFKKHYPFTICFFIVSILAFISVYFLDENSYRYSKFLSLIILSLTSLVLGCLIGVFFEIIYFSVIGNNKKEEIFPRNTLKDKEKTIAKRVNELNTRLNQVDVILNRIKERSAKNLKELQQKLLSAREIAFEQISKYKLQKHKIELVRLQNQVLPYSLYFNRLDEFRTEEAVIISEQTIREVGKIREDLAENFSNKADFEFKNFMRNLDETSNGCEKLWEALLNKQAMFALKDVQPLENLNALPQTNELAHAIETFNIESTLNDFSESFEQLEAEYKRLLADNEVSQKLLNYEN